MNMKSVAMGMHNNVVNNDVSCCKNFLTDRTGDVKMKKIVLSFNTRINAYSCDMHVISTPLSAFTKRLEIGTNVIFDKNGLAEFKDSTTDIISVEFNLNNLTKEFLNHNRNITVYDGVVRLYAITKKYAGFVSCYANNIKRNLTNEQNYTLCLTVPSGVRRYTAIYCRTDKLDKIKEILNVITSGTINNLVGKTVPIKKIVKQSARAGLLAVGGIYRDYDIHEYGLSLYLGKFGGKQERTDGGAKISSALLGEYLDITETCAKSLFVQCRVYKCSKVAATCESNKQLLFAEKLATKLSGKPIVYLDSMEELYAKQDELNGCVVHIGNKQTIGFLTDLNGMKMIPSITDKEDSFVILDYAMRKNTGTTNMQLLQYTMDYPGFNDIIFNIAKKQIKSQFKSILSKREYVKGFDPEKWYAPNLLPQINIDVYRQAYIRGGLEKAYVQGLNRLIHRMHFTLNATYLRGSCCPENWFIPSDSDGDQLVLKDNEVYINNKKDWGKEVVICRNPRSCGYEYFNATVVSLEEVVQRIMDCTEYDSDTKKYLIEWYSCASPSLLVVPGSVEFKDKTGGSDFDFDGFITIKDKNIIDMIKSIPSHRITIVKSEDSGETVKVNDIISMIQDSFIYSLCTGNSGVANIAIEDSKLQSLIFNKDTIGQNAIADIMDKYNCKGDSVYKRLFDKSCDIGSNEINTALDNFQNSLRCNETFINFAKDGAPMFVSIIGRVIDAAKSGEVVEDPFVINNVEVLQNVKQMFRNLNPENGKMFSFIDWDDKEKKFIPCIREKSFKRTDKAGNVIFYISDPVYEVQKRIVKWAVKFINRIRNLAAPTEEERNSSIKRMKAFKGYKSLKELDLATADLSRVFTEYKTENGYSVLSGKLLNNEVESYISNHARLILSFGNIEERDWFKTALSVSDIEVGTSFAYRFLKNETLRYVLNMKNSISVMRERVIPVKITATCGNVVFKNGRSSNFVCTTYKANGTYTVKYDKISKIYYYEVDIESLINKKRINTKMIIRVQQANPKIADVLNKFKDDKDTKFFISAYMGDNRYRDALWAENSVTGECVMISRILLGNDSISGKFHKAYIKLDHVIPGSLISGSSAKRIFTITICANIMGIKRSEIKIPSFSFSRSSF